jgi:hypothetical protein
MSLHSITLNGESLLLSSRQWIGRRALRSRTGWMPRWRGADGLESRRPATERCGWKFTFTRLVTGADVGKLREGLRSSARLRVAVPLWPDLLEVAHVGGGHLYRAERPPVEHGHGELCREQGGVSHPLRAPLLVGRLSDEPEMEVLAAGLSP